jgi:hypothetical protein
VVRQRSFRNSRRRLDGWNLGELHEIGVLVRHDEQRFERGIDRVELRER